MNKELLAETRREIAEWPGVTLSQENAGKHGKLVLHYKGESRLVVVSNTPSDVRVLKNHIAVVRRELRGLGAVRKFTPASATTRVRNTPNRIALPSSLAPIRPNPFDQLKEATMPVPKTIDGIFAGIERLTYGEMMQFCSILSDAGMTANLKRSDKHSWAKTMQAALDMRSDDYARATASPPASPEANATTSVDGDGAGEGRGR